MVELFREEETRCMPAVADGVEKYRKKRSDKKQFLSLLNELPEHIVEHYLTLLRLERDIWRKRS